MHVRTAEVLLVSMRQVLFGPIMTHLGEVNRENIFHNWKLAILVGDSGTGVWNEFTASVASGDRQ